MLMRVLKRFRPTPSTTVSLLALVVALGSTGYAANGAAFVLGVINSATQLTTLGANYNGAALKVSNTSTGAAATPLLLTAAAGHPPMKVNTVTKVVNLNADFVDGLDASTLTHAMRVNYNLAPGALSAPITVPLNVPVQLVGLSNSGMIAGVGQATLLHSSDGFLLWAGFSFSDTTPSSGSSSGVGTKIVSIGLPNGVVVETAGPSTIRVHNTTSFTVAGSVSLMW